MNISEHRTGRPVWLVLLWASRLWLLACLVVPSKASVLQTFEQKPVPMPLTAETDLSELSYRDLALRFGVGLASLVFVYTGLRLGSVRRRLSEEQRLREDLRCRVRDLRSELEAARNEIRQREAQLQEHGHARLSTENRSDDNTFIHRVIEEIGDGLAEEDFNVDELARRLAMDRSHLYRRVRALLGTTPSELIRSIRLQQAAALLGRQVGTVSEIGYQVGFRSASQFSRSFRNHYGIPPSEYQSADRPQDGSGSYSASAP